MTQQLLVLGLISLFSFAAVACLIVGGELLAEAYFQRWSGSTRATSQQALNELFIARITPRDVVLLTLVGVFTMGGLIWLISANALLTLAAGVLTFFLPGPLFMVLRRRRRRRFEAFLPTGLDQLVSSTRAGLNLIQALEEASLHAPEPVNQEFGLIVRDYRMGWDLASAIDSARQRLASRSFALVASALIINHDKGGNLPETLTTISRSLKEIWRLEQKILTASAEGRRGMRVISLVPVGVFLMIAATQPEIIDTLTLTWPGWILMAVALLLYGVGLMWAARVMEVDV